MYAISRLTEIFSSGHQTSPVADLVNLEIAYMCFFLIDIDYVILRDRKTVECHFGTLGQLPVACSILQEMAKMVKIQYLLSD